LDVERLRTRTGPAVAAVVLVLLLVSGIVAWRMGAQLEQLSALGYPGIFLLMVISGSAYFPVPGPPAVIVAGAIWNPLLVGLAAGLGNSTGEMTSYLLGRTAADALQNYRNARFIVLLERWLNRHGFLTILVLAAIPNPTFHALTLLAGTVGYPARRYWLACALGNTVKYSAMATLGLTASALVS
jgi:uncharacterized membrane protein YdjX (TVP38/TMEM64 family)